MTKLTKYPEEQPTQAEATMQEAIEIKIMAAASSVDGATGASALWRSNSDEPKHWHNRDLYSGSPYETDVMILNVLVRAIEDSVREIEPKDIKHLKITAVVIADSIVNGFNKQREVWESNGFINRLGNKVKYSGRWKKLFKLAERYSVTIRKPNGFSSVVQGCCNRARMVALEGKQTEIDNCIMREVDEAAARDKS